VAGSNIDGIELREVADSNIPARLEFEDDEAKQTVPDGSAMVEFSGFQSDDEFVLSLHPAADGSFSLGKIPTGKYTVSLSWDTAYVKSMRLGSTLIEGSILDLNNGSGGADLTIIVSAATGSVSGTVRPSEGSAAGTTVALTAADEESFFRQRTATAGADGVYSIANLPPGRYKLVALPEPETQAYEDQMETVEVRDREKVTKDLTLRTQKNQ
jgi:hypothetical protein